MPSYRMIPLTNPFSDAMLHLEVEDRMELSRSISIAERAIKVIDAVIRVIIIRSEAFKLQDSICVEVVDQLQKFFCFPPDQSLVYHSDMLNVAASCMDMFNQILASKLTAAPFSQNQSAQAINSILDDDFSLDGSLQYRMAPALSSSLVIETFEAEQKVVRKLLEFGRE